MLIEGSKSSVDAHIASRRSICVNRSPHPSGLKKVRSNIVIKGLDCMGRNPVKSLLIGIPLAVLFAEVMGNFSFDKNFYKKMQTEAKKCLTENRFNFVNDSINKTNFLYSSKAGAFKSIVDNIKENAKIDSIKNVGVKEFLAGKRILKP